MTKYIILLLVCIAGVINAHAQTGCTDPSATNYNPAATVNDGSCVYAATSYAPVLKVQLPDSISESSGMVYSGGKLWTHNDSGNPNEFFSIDTADGRILQRVIVDNFTNIDWEDITADNDNIYIGDHGNNNGSRLDLRVLKIAKADITSDPTVHVNAQAINFSYADQTSYTPSAANNFDCEALVSVDDSLYVFTKDRGDLQTRVYRMPKDAGTYVLTHYTSYDVKGLITGADYNAVTKEVILVGYSSTYISSFLWFLSDFKGTDFFGGNKRMVSINTYPLWQTEAVCYVSADRFFISNEKSSIKASLFGANRNWLNHTGVGNIAAPAFICYPNPATGVLMVKDVLHTTPYSIVDIAGRTINTGNLTAGNNEINVKELSKGNYVLHIQGSKPYEYKFVKQ